MAEAEAFARLIDARFRIRSKQFGGSAQEEGAAIPLYWEHVPLLLAEF
jgi:hypothetical protein